MTDNEIIKALECCICNECDVCPLPSCDGCVDLLLHNALSLINRQQAEIERLGVLVKERADVNFDKIATVVCRARADIKAQAIKEFADKLKSRVKGVGVHSAIDCVEMEMVGADNG